MLITFFFFLDKFVEKNTSAEGVRCAERTKRSHGIGASRADVNLRWISRFTW